MRSGTTTGSQHQPRKSVKPEKTQNRCNPTQHDNTPSQEHQAIVPHMNAHPKGDTNNQPARMTRTLDTQPGRHHIHPNKPANTQDEAALRHNTQTCAHPLHAYPLPLYQAQTVLTPPMKPTQAAHPSSPHRTNTPPLYAPSLTPHTPTKHPPTERTQPQEKHTLHTHHIPAHLSKDIATQATAPHKIIDTHPETDTQQTPSHPKPTPKTPIHPERTTKNHKTAPFQRKVPITREEGVSYTGTKPQNFRQAKPTHLVSRAAVAVVVLVSVVFVGGFVLACTGVRWGSLCRVGVGLGVGCGGVRLLS